MGKLYRQFLPGSKVYMCKSCDAHLADFEDIISPNFQGKHGRAYLFKKVVNVSVGVPEQRIMMTGLHTVADISCKICQNVVGWKYEAAFDESQQYKV
eukprot:c6667_g1_i1.p1 GENE.c6667_g1_i1~~c6667_g1_i1.p1  ORF type:complete len:112 (+),score=21.23 c6667_g1_i1:46-336(+)